MPRDISARWTVMMARVGVCTRSLMGDGCTVARTLSCSCVFTVEGISAGRHLSQIRTYEHRLSSYSFGGEGLPHELNVRPR